MENQECTIYTVISCAQGYEVEGSFTNYEDACKAREELKERYGTSRRFDIIENELSINQCSSCWNSDRVR